MKNEIDTILSKEKTVSDAERTTYMLLVDHPYFVENVASIRKCIGISRNGFTDGQHAYNWKHASKYNKVKLWDAAEKLIAKFNIKDAFRSDARFFAYDYILSPKIVENLLPLPEHLSKKEKEKTLEQVGRHKIGARVIQTSADVERNKYQLKANALYLEITNQTTTRDIDAAQKLVTKRKKDLRPFAMPKPQAKARLAWRMKTHGATNHEVANEINNQFGMSLKAQQIPLYSRRYEKALQKLKPFSKE